MLVAITQLRLQKLRETLSRAYLTGNWHEVQRLDKLTLELLQAAMDDPCRDRRALVCETQKITTLYRELVAASAENSVVLTGLLPDA